MDALTDEDVSKQISQQIGNLSVKNDVLTICASCGKEGKDLNVCNKCDLAAYCNAACKKKHQSKHKNECEKRAAELHDDYLFKQPPPPEDCPICMLSLPPLYTGYKYNSCCGKTICCGCIHAVALRDEDEQKCPFCRSPAPDTDEEIIKRVKKRMEMNDAEALYNMGCSYAGGLYGIPHDMDKAVKLWNLASKLSHTRACYNLGQAYLLGRGVERDMDKALHYWELAAMRGHADARQNLGGLEYQAGNMDRAVKHYIIAVSFGHTDCLHMMQSMYKGGTAKKDDYAKALRVYQACLNEIKSPQRNEAVVMTAERYY